MLDSLSNTLSTLEAENCQLAKHAEAEPEKGGAFKKKCVERKTRTRMHTHI